MKFRDDMLEVKVYQLSDMSVVAASGEIDLSNIGVVENAVSMVFDRDLPLLLDFTGLRYIDSTGLRVLTEISDRCQMRQTPFAVAADTAVRRICGVLSLETVFPIFPNPTLAREYFFAREPRPKAVSGGIDDIAGEDD